ncbi:hypothetical protein [Nocardiopsis alba]|uniref:hypothetical protein n=1 Tax=Nocardiopsis alba TaxID=53437 RepID=UPI0033A799B8
MITLIHARELAPGMVLGGGARAGQAVSAVEPVDWCWLQVTVTTPDGRGNRFQMAPATPVQIRR